MTDPNITPKTFAKRLLLNKWVIGLLVILLMIGVISLAIDLIVWLATVVFTLAGILVFGLVIAILFVVLRAKMRK